MVLFLYRLNILTILWFVAKILIKKFLQRLLTSNAAFKTEYEIFYFSQLEKIFSIHLQAPIEYTDVFLIRIDIIPKKKFQCSNWFDAQNIWFERWTKSKPIQHSNWGWARQSGLSRLYVYLHLSNGEHFE